MDGRMDKWMDSVASVQDFSSFGFGIVSLSMEMRERELSMREHELLIRNHELSMTEHEPSRLLVLQFYIFDIYIQRIPSEIHFIQIARPQYQTQHYEGRYSITKCLP